MTDFFTMPGGGAVLGVVNLTLPADCLEAGLRDDLPFKLDWILVPVPLTGTVVADAD